MLAQVVADPGQVDLQVRHPGVEGLVVEHVDKVVVQDVCMETADLPVLTTGNHPFTTS